MANVWQNIVTMLFRPCLKPVFASLIVTAGLSLLAAAPPHGGDRLRELVIYPKVNLGFQMGLICEGNEWVISTGRAWPELIAEGQEELKARPNDIKLLLHQGDRLGNDGRTNDVAETFRKAERLCRNKLASSPADGLTMTALGTALARQGKDTEAETFYRRATQVSSNEWRCWAGLGNFLALHASESLYRYSQSAASASAPDAAAPSPSSGAEIFQRAREELDESVHCFDRTRALAPKEAEVYLQCAGNAMVTNSVGSQIRRHTGQEKPADNSRSTLPILDAMIANLQTAAGLSPKNCEYPAMVAYFETMKYAAQAGNGHAPIEQWPADIRQPVLAMKTRLENLSTDPDQTTAAGALEYLGFIDLLLGNVPAAETCGSREVAIAPSRQPAYELWLLAAAQQPTPDAEKLVNICQSLLRVKNTARNHLLLAHAYQRQKKWAETRAQAEAALKLEPDNPGALLLLAALDLRQSADAEYLARAGAGLQSTQKILFAAPSGRFTDLVHDLYLDMAIYIDLTDLPNKKEGAKDLLEQILKNYPDDEQAKEIMSALE